MAATAAALGEFISVTVTDGAIGTGPWALAWAPASSGPTRSASRLSTPSLARAHVLDQCVHAPAHFDAPAVAAQRPKSVAAGDDEIVDDDPVLPFGSSGWPGICRSNEA